MAFAVGFFSSLSDERTTQTKGTFYRLLTEGNTAPVSWPVNGPKRLGIHLASDCGEPPCQWLRQTDLKPPQFASLYYCLKALMRSVPVLLVVIFLYISWLNLVCFLVTPNFALAP
jgi:hypothetical protein